MRPGPGHVVAPIRTLAARGRRQLWRWEEAVRSAWFGGHAGFATRPTPTATVALADRAPKLRHVPLDAQPHSVRIGLIGSHADSATGHAAQHFGLQLECAGPGDAADLLHRATREMWPLVTLAARANPEAIGPAMRAYLGGHGTVLIPELASQDGDWLTRLGCEVGAALPECRAVPERATHLTFASRRSVCAELAGLRMENSEAESWVAGADHVNVLATVSCGGRSLPAVVAVPLQRGQVVLSTGPGVPPGRLGDLFGPSTALSLLPAMMLARSLYGESAWRATASLANMTIDDPVLNTGPLGLDYRSALSIARDENFHLTVATIPRELGLADPAVVRLIAENRDRLSACYHGNDHDGYEFFFSETERGRFRRRSPRRQAAGLRAAAARGHRFARLTGYALDRVMVFPHGLGAPNALAELGRLGFLATSNWLDRYPLSSELPEDVDLGMRPADLAWSSFPLLWRRRLDDQTFPFDLFAGRPVIYFTHAKQAGAAYESVRARAAQISAIGGRAIRWCGLEEIAKHAHLRRRRPGAHEWDVLMTANEACLHNAGDEPRRFRVYRPNLPIGTRLVGPGAVPVDGGVEIVIPARRTATVRVAGPVEAVLPDPHSGRPCSLSVNPSTNGFAA